MSRVTAFGNPLIDVYAAVSPEIVTESGLEPGESIHRKTPGTEKLFAVADNIYDCNQNIDSSRITEDGGVHGSWGSAFAGGGAFTTARLLAKAGHDVTFHGSTGHDRGRLLFTRSAGLSGLKTKLAEYPGNSGCCRYITSACIEGSMVTAVSPGAALSYEAGDIPPEAVENDGWVYVEGFILARISSRVLLPDRKYMLAVDLGSPYAANINRDRLMREIQAGRLLLMGTVREFAAALECGPCDADKVLAACAALFDQHGTDSSVSFVIKDAEKGVYSVSTIGTLYQEPPLDGHIVPPQFRIGAGDSFAAGYLLGRMKGLDEKACLEIGTEYAGASLQRIGPLL